MNMNKPMGKRAAMIVLGLVIVAALLLGLLLVSKGDGPVAGMVLADRAIAGTDEYDEAAEAHSNGIYLVVANAFNKFREDYSSGIPGGSELFATVCFVECLKGSEFTAKWIMDDNVIREETKTLQTEPNGVISYGLGGAGAEKGSYVFELYDGSGNKIFNRAFSVE